MHVYNEQSSLQNARTTFQQFNVMMADLGDKILPAVNLGLSQFNSILKTLDAWLPKLPNGPPKSARMAAQRVCKM